MKRVVTALSPEPYRLENLSGLVLFLSAALLAGNEELDWKFFAGKILVIVNFSDARARA
jgi:hypothetical protein